MKKVILIIIVCLTVSMVCFGYQFFVNVFAMQQAKDIEVPAIENITSINDIVQAYVNDESTKALSIGIYDNGKTTYHNYGICSDKNPVPPDNQTIYEIGSITKTFTTAALVQLVEEGKVEYDDPIAKYLPKDVVNWGDSVAITLEELATHQSGLPRLPNNMIKHTLLNMDNPYKNYDDQDLYDFLKSYTPTPKDQRKVDYSNLGMGLLGHILAEVSNISYNELIKTKITKPLGMDDTYADFIDKKQVTGHNGYGKPTSEWELNALKGAGSIRSNTADLVKYMIVNLQSKFPFEETHNFKADFDEKTKIGLAWLTIFPKDTNLELLFHNGGTGGFRSTMLFSKEKQQGVVALSNGFHSVDAIGIRIMELLQKQSLSTQKSPSESE